MNTEKFTKMIVGCKKKNYILRLGKLRLTTLEERYQRADMIQVFKILKDEDNVYQINFLQLNERSGRRNYIREAVWS